MSQLEPVRVRWSKLESARATAVCTRVVRLTTVLGSCSSKNSMVFYISIMIGLKLYRTHFEI